MKKLANQVSPFGCNITGKFSILRPSDVIVNLNLGNLANFLKLLMDRLET